MALATKTFTITPESSTTPTECQLFQANPASFVFTLSGSQTFNGADVVRLELRAASTPGDDGLLARVSSASSPTGTSLTLVFTSAQMNQSVDKTVTDYALTLRDYARSAWSHCGIYARWMLAIVRSLGLQARQIVIGGSWHGVVEVWIDGGWRTYDPTSNIRFDVSVEALMNGEPRTVWHWYAPVMDMNADPVWREHLTGGWDVPGLWRGMPDLGMTYGVGKTWEIVD